MQGFAFHKGKRSLAFLRAISNVVVIILFMIGPLAGGENPSFSLSGIDGVFEKDSSLIVFKFSNWSYIELIALPEGKQLQWKSLLRPDYSFIPHKILAGQSNNFLVFDIGGEKIWQLSSEMQFLTHYPLPGELLNKNLSEMQILFALDYKFYFIFPSQGRAYQYHISGRKLQFIRDFKNPGDCRDFFPAIPESGHKLGPQNVMFICRTKNNIKTFDPFLSPVSSNEKIDAFLFRYNLGDHKLCYHVEEGRLEICGVP